jgi:hypothetical protein
MTAPTTTRSGSRRCDLRSCPSSIHSIDPDSSWSGRRHCSTSFRLIALGRHLHVRRFHPHPDDRDSRNGSHYRRERSDSLGLHCLGPLGSAGSGAPKWRDGSAVVTARAFEGF